MAYIRKHKTSYGEYGTMTNKHLAEYADKLVLVSVEIVTSDTKLPPVKVKGVIKERPPILGKVDIENALHPESEEQKKYYKSLLPDKKSKIS
jgi:hypothetical protein